MMAQVQKFSIVVGSRYIQGGGTKNWSIFRKINSRVANSLARIMLNLKCHDATAGFRLYRKEVLQSVDFSRIYSEGYSFLIEVLYICQAKGYAIAEVPIIFEDREAGKSKISRTEIFKAIKTLGKYWLKRILYSNTLLLY
jgi:dolichol-phosphate mannosyltransferase